MRHLTFLSTLFFLFALASVSRAEIQNFDSEAAASAAGWTEFDSRINNFDFGFSATNHAGGVSGQGEGGGVIARSQPRAYYGDVTIGPKGGLEADLHATGRLNFQDSAFDGEFSFGWFDKDEAEANNGDYIGIRVREPNDGLWRINASIDGADGDRLNLPNDTAFDFEIDWDADGGDDVGTGKLTVGLSTLDGAQSWESVAQGFDGVLVDAFGLLANAQAGNAAQIGTFTFDDLEYTLGDRPDPPPPPPPVEPAPFPGTIGYVVDPDRLLDQSIDQFWVDRLREQGHEVIVVGDADGPGFAPNADFFIISGDVDSGTAGGNWGLDPRPLINHESAAFDELGMSSGNANSDGATIQIVDPVHPLAAGFSGTVQIFSSPQARTLPVQKVCNTENLAITGFRLAQERSQLSTCNPAVTIYAKSAQRSPVENGLQLCRTRADQQLLLQAALLS